MRKQRPRPDGARPQVIRMVLVEQHPIVRAVLRDIVDREPDIEVVGEGRGVDDAIPLVRDQIPDIVLVDTDGPIAAMVPAVQRLKHECPGAAVVVLGNHRGDDDLFAAIQSGASAHLLDDVRPSELVRTIRAVADGEYLIDDAVAARPAVARHVLEAFRDASLLGHIATDDLATSPFAPLSDREAQILKAIAAGMTNREVAQELSITEQTVKNHVTSILRKLAVNDRTQAVLYALKKSWISISPEPPRRRN